MIDPPSEAERQRIVLADAVADLRAGTSGWVHLPRLGTTTDELFATLVRFSQDHGVAVLDPAVPTEHRWGDGPTIVVVADLDAEPPEGRRRIDRWIGATRDRAHRLAEAVAEVPTGHRGTCDLEAALASARAALSGTPEVAGPPLLVVTAGSTATPDRHTSPAGAATAGPDRRQEVGLDDARRWCRALTAEPARAAVAETLDECLDGGGGASVLVDALLVLAVAQHLAGRPDAGDAALSLRTELDPGADALDVAGTLDRLLTGAADPVTATLPTGLAWLRPAALVDRLAPYAPDDDVEAGVEAGSDQPDALSLVGADLAGDDVTAAWWYLFVVRHADVLHERGWHDLATNLRAAQACFEARGLAEPVRRARGALRDLGLPVGRRGRGSSDVPPELAAYGVTSREVDILALLCRSMTNKEIAWHLYLSSRTVAKHVSALLAKTGRSDRKALRELVEELDLELTAPPMLR